MSAKLVPYLMSEDARVQAEFYKNALGGEIHLVKTLDEVPGTPDTAKDKVMHLVLSVAGENTLFLSDSFLPAEASRKISLSLAFDDEEEARNAFLKLSEAGTEQYPFAVQPWGAFYGEVVDRYGITWQIVQM